MKSYCGRFAPTPSGPLHLGSLVTAVASYLDARLHQGLWLVRIEDIDHFRTAPGAEDTILRQLEGCGLGWDGGIIRQSERHEIYGQVLRQLGDRAYACTCSRKDIGEGLGRGSDGAPIYPGTCRNRGLVQAAHHAIRLRTEGGAGGVLRSSLGRSEGGCGSQGR